MFTANSISVFVGFAIVLVSCATLAPGAPSVASSLYWGPKQSQPNHWSSPQSDLFGHEKFPFETPFELKPYWPGVLENFSGETKYPQVPSFDLQPPPPPPAPPTSPKPDDQISGEQVSDNELEDYSTLGPDLDSEEQVTNQASVQTTEQIAEQVAEQVTEQVTDHDIDSASYLSYMPKKENKGSQPLSDSELAERKRTYEMFMNYMRFLQRSAHVPINWYNEKDVQIGEPNSLWRLRRSTAFSEDYGDSDDEGTGRTGLHSQASASAGSGQDLSGIEGLVFPTLEIFKQIQQQGYPHDSQFGYNPAMTYPDFPNRGGADQTGTGISARIEGPSNRASSGSISIDDGNGKKTQAVYANLH